MANPLWQPSGSVLSGYQRHIARKVVVRLGASLARTSSSSLVRRKNMFYLVGFDRNGAIVLRQKLSRRQVEARLAANVGFESVDA